MASGTGIFIENVAGTISVNLTNLSPNVSRDGTNPLIVISVPTDETASTTAGGAETMNLRMMKDSLTVSFKLTDGLGEHRYTIATASTNYEKLEYLFKYDEGKKKFYWGDTTKATCLFYVVIERLSIPTEAAKKDLIENCQMVLTVVNA